MVAISTVAILAQVSPLTSYILILTDHAPQWPYPITAMQLLGTQWESSCLCLLRSGFVAAGILQTMGIVMLVVIGIHCGRYSMQTMGVVILVAVGLRCGWYPLQTMGLVMMIRVAVTIRST